MFKVCIWIKMFHFFPLPSSQTVVRMRSETCGLPFELHQHSVCKRWQSSTSVGLSSATESCHLQERLPHPTQPHPVTAPRCTWNCWLRRFTESAHSSSLSSTKASSAATGKGAKFEQQSGGSFTLLYESSDSRRDMKYGGDKLSAGLDSLHPLSCLPQFV